MEPFLFSVCCCLSSLSHSFVYYFGGFKVAELYASFRGRESATEMERRFHFGESGLCWSQKFRYCFSCIPVLHNCLAAVAAAKWSSVFAVQAQHAAGDGALILMF